MSDEPPREMGLLGQYTGLQDKDGKPIRIGHVIRLEDVGSDEEEYALGRVWYMAPELCARRVDEKTGELMDGSYSLVDWGYGTRVQEFTLIDPHPGATWPQYFCSTYCEHNAKGECACQPCTFLRANGGVRHEDRCTLLRSESSGRRVEEG